MSRDAAWLPSEVAEQLVELKTWVRWQWLLRGAGRVGLITSLSLGGALLVDYRMDLSPFARGVAATSVAALTLLALITWVLVPMCRRMGWNELAALAERAHPEWKGCLTSSVELNDPSHVDSFAGSPVMRQLLQQQAGDRVAELDVERVISSPAAWRSVKLGLAACFLLAAPIFVAPSTYRQLWQRLLVPWGNWGTAGAWQIDVVNGDRVVARGSDVELLATAKYSKETEAPKSLLLEWRDAAGTTDRRTMPFDDAREAFVAVVPHVMRDFDFHVVVNRQHSRDYRVQVVESPVVTKVRLDVEPPAYAGWPAQTIDGAVGSIRVFEHSHLRFTLEFNKPVEQAEFVWRARESASGGTEFTLADDQQSATVEFKADPKFSGPFAFAVQDHHDLTNNDAVPRELLVITDEPPQLTVKGEHSAEVRPDDIVPIDITANDDIGVGELELHVEISGRKEPELQTAEQVRGQKQVEQRFTLDLAKLNLEQGQWLTYKVRVTDERPEPGPQEVWSEPRVLRINRKAAPPGANELARSHDELQNEIKDLWREMTEKRDSLEKLRKEAELASRNKQEPPSRERFEELERQLHELTQRSEKLAEQLAADPIFNELGEKVREVAQQELHAAEKETQLAKDAQGAEQSQDLRRAEQQLENAVKKLQQLDKPFQQLADLQRDLLELRRLARQADQLANRADELAKNDSANADAAKSEAPAKDDPNQPEAPAKKQNAAEAAKIEQEKQQLAQEQQKLADALDDLLKKRPELLNAAKRDQLEQLAELSKQARELADEQQKLADAMKERQQESAAKTAELAQRQEDLQKRAEQAAVEAETRDRTQNVSPVNPEPLRDAVAALQQGNLDEARRQQEEAANELDRLAAELEKANAAAEAQQAGQKPAEQPNIANADSKARPDNTKPNADAANDANQPNDATPNEDKPSQKNSSNDQPMSEGPATDKGQDSDSKPSDNQPSNEPNNEANEPGPANRLTSLAKAARQLANEQAELAAKANEARAEQTPQQRQKVAEQLAREQDQLKDRIAELPVQAANKSDFDKAAPNDPKAPEAPQDGNTPKGDASTGDAPKNDVPKGDAANAAAPKGDDPKGDAPKNDAPRSERQKNDGPKNDSETSPNQAPNARPSEEQEPPKQERKPSGSEAAQQRAVQHAEQAREALAQGNLDRAAQEQRRTEQALHDVAARAEAAEQMQQANAPQGQSDQNNTLPNKTGEKGDPTENNNAPDANAPNRGLPQPEQVAQLAEEQRQLMQEVARALEQQQGANANPRQQAGSEQQTAGNDAPMPQNNDANQTGQQPQADTTKEGQNKSQSQDSPTAQKVRDTQAAQNELAQQAQQLAEQVKQELGKNSKETQEATQAARLCEACQGKASSGQFGQASQTGKQASQAASQLAQSLQANPRANSELGQQAASIAEQQQQLAEQMEQLRQTPGAPAAAQQQRQSELNNASGQLGQQLDQSKSRLGQLPLNQQQAAKDAQKASEQTARAQQNMQAAKQASQSGNAGEAAQSAQQAAEALRDAADEAQPSGRANMPPKSPLPRGVGDEIAQATEKLRKAGESQSKESPSQSVMEMARRLREAAQALAQAANQSAPLPNNSQRQPSNDSTSNDNNLTQQAAEAGNGNGSTQQNSGDESADLQAQLRKLTGRNWGQLSSKLRTELLQAAKHQAHGDYNRLIKLYFQEIAKTAPDNTPAETKP